VIEASDGVAEAIGGEQRGRQAAERARNRSNAAPRSAAHGQQRVMPSCYHERVWRRPSTKTRRPLLRWRAVVSAVRPHMTTPWYSTVSRRSPFLVGTRDHHCGDDRVLHLDAD
jgi:hypothetical protein